MTPFCYRESICHDKSPMLTALLDPVPSRAIVTCSQVVLPVEPASTTVAASDTPAVALTATRGAPGAPGPQRQSRRRDRVTGTGAGAAHSE